MPVEALVALGAPEAGGVPALGGGVVAARAGANVGAARDRVEKRLHVVAEGDGLGDVGDVVAGRELEGSLRGAVDAGGGARDALATKSE